MHDILSRIEQSNKTRASHGLRDVWIDNYLHLVYIKVKVYLHIRRIKIAIELRDSLKTLSKKFLESLRILLLFFKLIF